MLDFKSFFFNLTVFLCIFFTLHLAVLYYLKLPLFDNQILGAYVFNYVMTLSIYFLLHKKSKTQTEQLGFLFMAGSFLKFIFFFLLFYNTYKADGKIDRQEFLAFFIPYLVCLFLETFTLAKRLNK